MGNDKRITNKVWTGKIKTNTRQAARQHKPFSFPLQFATGVIKDLMQRGG
jgi:hypothetical protein